MLQENLIKIYEASFRENRELPALTDYFKNETFNYFELAREIAKLHILFEKADIKPGDKIALLGRNNPRWCIVYMAVITYGAVLVPILQDFSANDILHILNHSDSVMFFTSDRFWDEVDIESLSRIRAVFSLDDFQCLYEPEEGGLGEFQRNIQVEYRKRYPRGFTAENITYPHIDNDAVCVISYTSGTTGFTKGVMLTVNNLTGNVVFGIRTKLHYRGSRVLSFLPLAHAFGCAFDFLLPLAAGGHITLLGKIPTPKLLLEALQKVQPSLICTVPLIMEKVYRKQIKPMLSKNTIKMALKVPLINNTIYLTIRQKLIDAFGGKFDQVIVGGAPLNAEVEEFLYKIKFPFTVGYGMTECAPLISYTHHSAFVPTSCGQVLKGLMEARIDSPDPENIPGEIIVRGEHVMKGYYKNGEATRDILKDGWLHTGDIATMSPDHTLFIKGRSKTMLLSGSGQNIYPEEIESKLNNMSCVLESLVVERDGKLVALVYPDYEEADCTCTTEKDINKVMDENLAELNAIVAPYERISAIILYPNEFEKTPKRSIKRCLYNV